MINDVDFLDDIGDMMLNLSSYVSCKVRRWYLEIELVYEKGGSS